MNTKVKRFINSNILERYILGQTTKKENKTVAEYLYTYTEVQEAYNLIQKNLEIVSKRDAVEVPNSQLDFILKTINDKPIRILKTDSPTSKKSWFPYSIAASFVAFVLAGTAYMFYNHSQKLTTENQVIVEEIFDLRSDIDKNNKLLDAVMRQFQQLNDPNTQKYVINGNQRAKNLKTVAYINSKDKTSIIDAVSLPELPKEQYYEIWAELQDRMISLGILKEDERKLLNIPYADDVLSLKITIENKNGDAMANNENTVAKHDIKNN